MKYLLDTCLLSEAFKNKPNQQVIDWLGSVDEQSLYQQFPTNTESPLLQGI